MQDTRDTLDTRCTAGVAENALAAGRGWKGSSENGARGERRSRAPGVPAFPEGVGAGLHPEPDLLHRQDSEGASRGTASPLILRGPQTAVCSTRAAGATVGDKEGLKPVVLGCIQTCWREPAALRETTDWERKQMETPTDVGA